MKKLALGALIAAFAACGGGSATPKDTGGGDDTGSGAIDAPPACSVFADAGAQGCATGEKCTWIIDDATADTGHLGCATAGGAAIGAKCTFSNADHSGFDSCATGGFCIGGICEQICDNTGTAKTCDSAHSCGTYEGVFGPPGGTDIAGVCDPTCDPLTQSAGSAIACGGALACEGSGSGCGSNGPSLGCYASFGQGTGTCANTPESRGTAATLDDKPCTHAGGCANASEQAFLNGCGPGYVPFFRDQPGSTTVDCDGLCAPKDADNVTLAEVGDPTALGKLPQDPAPVVGHSTCQVNKKALKAAEECSYSWPFLVGTDGTLPDSPFNDGLGICFDYGKFKYDPTQNGSGSANPIPEVNCNQLRPGTLAESEAKEGSGTVFAKCSSFSTGSEEDCFAVKHQCYSAERSGFGSGSGSAAFAGAHFTKPFSGIAAHYRMPLSMGTLKFRRAGGIH